MIRALVVEDSVCARELLIHTLQSDPAIEVIGAVGDGLEALSFLEKEKPDVITMDIHLPHLDGMETTRRIMATHPVPIVIVSGSWRADEVSTTSQAMEAGALAVADKPRGGRSPEAARLARQLVQTVKAMSEVRVVRRRARSPARTSDNLVIGGLRVDPPRAVEVVAIGASTGGPPVLQTILRSLPAAFPAPVLIVQHIAAGFLPGMARWLNDTTGFPTHIGTHGELANPGSAYLAPDNLHMGLDSLGRIALSDSPPENGLRPAVAHLFRSVLAVHGTRAVGILLTGMGRDGAHELKLLRERGAFTIAQDAESSVVHGMPGEAIRLQAASYILPPEKMGPMLSQIVPAHRT
jgi:two-component system chemotaxis response regulator CheB